MSEPRLPSASHRKAYRKPLPSAPYVPVAPHPGAFGVSRKHDVHTGVDLYASESTPVYAIEDGKIVEILEFTGEGADPPSPWWNRTQAVLVEGRSGVILYGEVSASWISTKPGFTEGLVLPYPSDSMQFGLLSPSFPLKHHPYFPEDPEFPELTSSAFMETAALSPEDRVPEVLRLLKEKKNRVYVGQVRVGDRVAAGDPIGCIVPVLKREKASTISRYMVHIELLQYGSRTDAGVWSLGTPRPEHCFDPTPMLLQAV